MLLQYFQIIFLPHDAIYFLESTSPISSKATQQHNAATPVLHSWDDDIGMESLTLFPPHIALIIVARKSRALLIVDADTFAPCVSNSFASS